MLGGEEANPVTVLASPGSPPLGASFTRKGFASEPLRVAGKCPGILASV